MGDLRYAHPYHHVAHAQDRTAAISALSSEEVVMALAAASREKDALLANVLATEAMNRMQRAHAVAENLADGVFALDIQGRLIYANPAASRLLGYGREEMRGLSHERVHCREDGATMPEEDCIVLRTLRTGRAYHRHGEGDAYRRKDGTLFPVSLSSAPILRDGEVIGAVSTFQDVTRERQVQEAIRRLASIVEHSPDGIFSVSPEGIVTQANPAVERIYGNPREEVVGGPLWNDQSPDEPEEVYARLGRILAGEVVTAEAPWMRKDGRLVHTAITAFPVKDEQERVVGLSAIARDVTDRKRAEEERDRLHRALSRRLHTWLPAVSWGAGCAAVLLVLTMLAAALYPSNIHDHVLFVGTLLALLLGVALGVGIYLRRGRLFERAERA